MPTSLMDIATDGVLAQHDVDATTVTVLGPVESIEFSGSAPDDDTRDALFDLRITRAGRRPEMASGTRAAIIRDGRWHWRTARIDSFDVPALLEVQPADDLHLRVTRTLFGNAQVYLAPHKNGSCSVVALNGTPPTSPLYPALVQGVATVDPGVDIYRAVTSFAASRGLGAQRSEDGITLSDGTQIVIRDNTVTSIGGGATFDDVYADGILTSIESRLFFGSRHPQAHVIPNLATGRALVQPQGQPPFEVDMQIIATCTGDQGTWAWADPNLAGSPAMQSATAVRRFAFDNGIPQLLRPHFSPELIDDYLVVSAPITGLWTPATVYLEPGTSGYVLLSDPQLVLPPATQEAVDATVARLPDTVDRGRALAAYARNRGVTVGADGAITV